MLGPALSTTYGWKAPETEAAYARAHELCQELNEEQLAPTTVYGLALMHEFRGDFDRAQELLTPGLEQPDAETTVAYRELMACSTFHQGRFTESIAHADRGIELTDPDLVQSFAVHHGEHPTVHNEGWAAMSLWFLGDAGRALERADGAVALSDSHMFSKSFAQLVLAYIHQFQRDAVGARRFAEATIELSTDLGFPVRVSQAQVLRGWARAVADRDPDGVAELREGLSGCERAGALLDYPYYLGLLAEAAACTGDAGTALATIDEALSVAQSAHGFFFEPELHRLCGMMLLEAADGPRASEAEASFERGLALASSQQSRTLELRSAVSLARSWSRHGRSKEALALIEPIRAAFPATARTIDLEEADALLTELRSG